MKMFYAVSVPYGDLFYFYWNSAILQSQIKIVSVPYGDLFYFYLCPTFTTDFSAYLVSVPYGDLFYFYVEVSGT